jgi:hypothetical protein
MEKFWAMFRLREDVSLTSYCEWAENVDLQITPFEPGVIRFDIWATRAGWGEPPFDVVEEFEVDSFAAWQQELSTNPRLIPVVKAWDDYGDKSSVLTLIGRRMT